jgi:hypothetical protein
MSSHAVSRSVPTRESICSDAQIDLIPSVIRARIRTRMVNRWAAEKNREISTNELLKA